MELVIEIINYVFSAIIIGVIIAWIILLKTILISFRDSPYLDKFEQTKHDNPKVSIIVPARNEEKRISRCLDSLLDQDYKNYEVIVIDDSSEDSTGQIIKKYAEKNSKIIPVSARPKPENWMGKNWACMEGYKKATGELLLYTDSDTKYSEKVVSLAVSHMLSSKLDALTVIPKLLCLDIWTKITLPVLFAIFYARFSALRVNDTSKKTGYFFGSFFIIKKKVYEEIGTHEGVKHEILEDGALGKKVKEGGYRLKMVRGEHLIEAVWSSSWSTLWNGLKRLIIPIYYLGRGLAVSIFFGIFFLMLFPFTTLVYSGIFFNETISFMILLVSSVIASGLIYFASFIDAIKGFQEKWGYCVFAPIGIFITVSGFLVGILLAKSEASVSWRGRKYSIKEQNCIIVEGKNLLY